jgi:sugar transferase (PEP-CTERM/EpsH1 system associated)
MRTATKKIFNILFLSTENPFPPDHGHHLRTYYLLKNLAAQHRIFFLAFAQNQKELEHKAELEKFCASVELVWLPQGKWRWRTYAAVLANFFSLQPYTVKRYASAEADQRIQRLLSNHRIDLVHFDLPHLASYLNQAASLPKILVTHNVESLRMLRWAKVERNYLLKLYLYYQYAKLYRFEAKLCRQFDKCTTVSEIDKQILLEMCRRDNFASVPNGVDVEYFRPNDGGKFGEGLVWAGSMRGAYNRDAVDYFLTKIAPIIHSRMPETKMQFVGAAPTKLLEKCARENERIQCAGYVDDVRPYVDSAAVFIAPIRSGSGTKVKILNAMAQAKPVVTTPVGAEGIEAAPDEEILIANDENEFAEKTIFLLQNPQRAHEIGLRARRIIEKLYDWKIVAATMNDIYEKVVAERAAVEKLSRFEKRHPQRIDEPNG